MALLSMPPEILIIILSILEDDETARRALILTHSVFLNYMKSRHYSHLTLKDATSCRKILAIMEDIHAEHVLTITYSPECVPLSPETRHVLRTLQLFPNLSQVDIVFDWDYDMWTNPDMEGKVHSIVQSSVRAISESRAAFSGLRLQMYPPPHAWDCDIFKTGPWKALLRRLRSFSIEIMGTTATIPASRIHALYRTEGFPQRTVTMTEDHTRFLRQFRSTFLDELHILEHFRMSGCSSAIILPKRIYWHNMQPLNHLKSFTIEHALLGASVVEALISHSTIGLHKIHFRSCIGKPQLWIRLFEGLYNDHRKPGSVSIIPMPVHKALSDETRQGWETRLEWDKAQKKLLDEVGDNTDMLLKDPRVRLFPEARMLCNGTLLPLDRQIRRRNLHYLRGRDRVIQASWSRFLSRMEKNRRMRERMENGLVTM